MYRRSISIFIFAQFLIILFMYLKANLLLLFLHFFFFLFDLYEVFAKEKKIVNLLIYFIVFTEETQLSEKFHI